MSLTSNWLPVFLEVEGHDPTFVVIDIFEFEKSKHIIKGLFQHKVRDVDLYCYHDGATIGLWNEEVGQNLDKFTICSCWFYIGVQGCDIILSNKPYSNAFESL